MRNHLIATLAILAGCTTQNPVLLNPDMSPATVDLSGITDLSHADSSAADLAQVNLLGADLASADLAALPVVDLLPPPDAAVAPDLSVPCVTETDQGFCSRLGKSCGQVVGFDNCGASRTTTCGACQLPESCGANHVCGCVEESDAAFCARLGNSCGTVVDDDNCGQPRTAVCGPSCPCVPESDDALCQRFNLSCTPAEAADNCGTERKVSCRNGCVPGICPGRSDGSNCATSQIGGDWMNNCKSQICLPALSFCQLDSGSGTFSFQSPGTGGAGANSCSCTTSTHLALRFNSIPAANIDMDCAECVQLTGRVVCF